MEESGLRGHVTYASNIVKHSQAMFDMLRQHSQLRMTVMGWHYPTLAITPLGQKGQPRLTNVNLASGTLYKQPKSLPQAPLRS
jgi:hypothetical protein